MYGHKALCVRERVVGKGEDEKKSTKDGGAVVEQTPGREGDGRKGRKQEREEESGGASVCECWL